MTLSDLQILLDYNYWARDRMFEALDLLTPEQFTREMGGSFTSIRETAAHMLAAEIAWHMRWHGESPTSLQPADRFPDVASLRAEWVVHEGKMRQFFASLDEAGINRVYEYRLVSGAAGRSPFWQMLQHLINHGTYHRGQVTTLLRQIGAQPPQTTDLIGYYRVVAGG